MWQLVFIPTIGGVAFNVDGATKVPEYGICVLKRISFIEFVIAFIVSILIASVVYELIN